MATSDSDDERPPQRSDHDVLRDEQDVEELLEPRRTGLKSLWKGNDADPNQPQPGEPLTRSQQRRVDRRTRRRRRRGQTDDETGLVYEREGLVASGSDESVTSLDALPEKAPLRKGSRRFRIVMVFIGLTVLLLALLYGTYQTSTHDAALVKQPELRSNGSSLFAPTTLLISLDGFRADFLNRGLTPTLSQFIKDGVSPKYMLPSFPSLTFPNHWTLVTGQYPESHGVVGNSFWDPQLEEEFWYTDPARSMDPKWWASTGAEPLWSTAEAQGIRAAVHMWPGSEAGVEPAPTYLDRFNGKETLSHKVNKVLGYIDRPGEFDGTMVANDAARPRFISFYVPNVDTFGHRYGPNSTEMQQAIMDVDLMLQVLMDSLTARNLTDIVNVVVVSDHGMATTSVDRLYQLDDLLDVDDIAHIDGWPLYGLRPQPNVDLDALYASLKQKTAGDPHLDVYRREDMPERWHFSQSDRIAPLWLIPEAGWAILQRKDFDIAAARKAGKDYTLHGLHGYDHAHPLMRAIFVARGPAFPHAPHSELAVFQNVEVYNIVCESLGVTPRPNNGTLHLPLKPVGVHGQAPGDMNKTPVEGETEDEEEEPMPGELGFFEKLKENFKETLHKIASIFSSAEAAAEAAEAEEGSSRRIRI